MGSEGAPEANCEFNGRYVGFCEFTVATTSMLSGRTWSRGDHAYVAADDDEIVEFHAAPHLDPIATFADASA